MGSKPVVRIVVIALTGLSLAMGVARSHAQPLGTAFTYQGRLTDGGSAATGTYDLQLVLFDAALGGIPMGPTLLRDDVAVTNGLFTVSLDFGPGFTGSRRWLEIGVRPGASTGAYTTLSPRQELSPSPNAIFSALSASAPWLGITGKPAGFADGVDNDVLGGLACASGQVAKWNGANWTCAADWGLAGNAGTNPASNFIGTTDNVPFEVRVNNQRALRLERVTTTVGSNSWVGQSVLGGDAGNTIASAVTQATIAGGGGTVNGNPVPNRVTDVGGTVGGGGNNQAGDGGTPDDKPWATVGGGLSNTASGSGATVAGGGGNAAGGIYAGVGGGLFNTASRDYAVVAGGQSNTASGSSSAVPGGRSNFAGGDYSLAAGRQAKVRTPAQVGLGDVDGDEGTFVWADSTLADFVSTGPNQFLIRAAGGVGVNTNAPGFALEVSGSADTEIGIRSTGSGGRIWTLQSSATSGLAGTFQIIDRTANAARLLIDASGAVSIPGTLSKGAGAFKIDHPLDPENRYLYHSFVESPDMMNIYNGNVTTDGEGYATVELPEWFEALNRDFRYQLTVIGDGAWARARIARKIERGRFVVQTDVPSTEVSWQVTGIRRDAFAEKHRIPVEQDKPEGERGRCLYPEACGQEQ